MVPGSTSARSIREIRFRSAEPASFSNGRKPPWSRRLRQPETRLLPPLQQQLQLQPPIPLLVAKPERRLRRGLGRRGLPPIPLVEERTHSLSAIRNPFAASAAPAPAQDAFASSHVADDAPPGSYTYTLIKSGPDVNPDEVELGHVTSVEVMILWDTTVLHVQHLTPPRSFYVGEEEERISPATISSRPRSSGRLARRSCWRTTETLPWSSFPGRTERSKFPGSPR